MYLLGCYQDFGKANPNVLTPVIHSLFMEYPGQVVMRAVRDIPRQMKFLPTIFEITEALDEHRGELLMQFAPTPSVPVKPQKTDGNARFVNSREYYEFYGKAPPGYKLFIHGKVINDKGENERMEFAEGDRNTPKVQTPNWVLIPRPRI